MFFHLKTKWDLQQNIHAAPMTNAVKFQNLQKSNPKHQIIGSYILKYSDIFKYSNVILL